MLHSHSTTGAIKSIPWAFLAFLSNPGYGIVSERFMLHFCLG